MPTDRVAASAYFFAVPTRRWRRSRRCVYCGRRCYNDGQVAACCVHRVLVYVDPHYSKEAPSWKSP